MKRLAIDYINDKYVLIVYKNDEVSSIEEFTDYEKFMNVWNEKTYELLFSM